eukprot:m.218848 g.218848  ORF g.218848 m.218848 type:complete len:318 (+) comp39911_c0_seq1:2092-3045(+)
MATDDQGKHPLHYAWNAGVCESLLSHGADVRAKDILGNDPPFTADSSCVELLIKYGADVKAINHDGDQALHYHIKKNSSDNWLTALLNRYDGSKDDQQSLLKALNLCYQKQNRAISHIPETPIDDRNEYHAHFLRGWQTRINMIVRRIVSTKDSHSSRLSRLLSTLIENSHEHEIDDVISSLENGESGNLRTAFVTILKHFTNESKKVKSSAEKTSLPPEPNVRSSFFQTEDEEEKKSGLLTSMFSMETLKYLDEAIDSGLEIGRLSESEELKSEQSTHHKLAKEKLLSLSSFPSLSKALTVIAKCVTEKTAPPKKS